MPDGDFTPMKQALEKILAFMKMTVNQFFFQLNSLHTIFNNLWVFKIQSDIYIIACFILNCLLILFTSFCLRKNKYQKNVSIFLPMNFSSDFEALKYFITISGGNKWSRFQGYPTYHRLLQRMLSKIWKERWSGCH